VNDNLIEQKKVFKQDEGARDMDESAECLECGDEIDLKKSKHGETKACGKCGGKWAVIESEHGKDIDFLEEDDEEL